MDYDIYREELAIKHPAYGHALWEPSPREDYTAVEIGDVGFIREGRFHRLFNILLPEDHPSHQDGVPQDHEPLQLRVTSPTNTGKLPPNNLRSSGVLDESGDHRLGAAAPDEATEHSFSCSKKRGAILALPVPAQRTDTAARGDFARCMIRHIDVWFAFAQQRGLGISREDLILVTGCHLAKSWATIAFQEKGDQVAFGVRVSGDSNVAWQFTSEGAKGVPYNLGPRGQNLPENQCIFIRGFRAAQFSVILPRLRGAAGPAEDPDSDDDSDCGNKDVQLPGVPVDTTYQDPLCTLLEYISAEAPDCDMGLIHDDDLQSFCSPTLESLRPDSLMSYLHLRAPLIWQYSCDFPPTSQSDKGKSETKARSLTVATLSKFDIADDFEPVVTCEVKPVVPSKVKSVASSEAKPVAPSEVKPVAPNETKPVAPIKVKPVAPSEAKPVAPSKVNSVASSEAKPVTTSETKPVTTSETKSVTPSEAKPVAPSKVKSVAPSEAKPVTPSEIIQKESTISQVIRVKEKID